MKLQQSILDEKRNRHNLKVIDLEINLLRDKLKEKQEFYENLTVLKTQLEVEEKDLLDQRRSIDHNQVNSEVWNRLTDNLEQKYIFVFDSYEGDDFIKKKRDSPLTLALETTYKQSDPQIIKRLNEYDPYHEIEAKMLKKEAALTFDVYINDFKETVKKRVTHESYRQTYLDMMREYFERSRSVVEKKNEIKHLEDFLELVGSDQSEIEMKLKREEDEREEMSEKVEKATSNINVQLRFTKLFVEIDLSKVVDLLKDAILIKKKILDTKNKKIQEKGELKVDKLKQNLKQKNTVKGLRYDVMIKDLDIEEKIIESMAITRLKVTKNLQRALAKNENQMSEVNYFKKLIFFLD